jgi:hypothetical protein
MFEPLGPIQIDRDAFSELTMVAILRSGYSYVKVLSLDCVFPAEKPRDLGKVALWRQANRILIE